jgi:hypothetical protein
LALWRNGSLGHLIGKLAFSQVVNALNKAAPYLNFQEIANGIVFFLNVNLSVNILRGNQLGVLHISWKEYALSKSTHFLVKIQLNLKWQPGFYFFIHMDMQTV